MGKSNYYDKMEWQDSIKVIITQKLHQIRNWEFHNMLYGMSTIEIIENLIIENLTENRVIRRFGWPPTKWVLKFLILWSDEINHSNFENATKCLNKSWWYLLKHACFILKLKDLCNTCVHFQWKKTNSSRHIGILSALRMRGLHDKRQLLAKLRITGSENCLPIA